MQSLIKKLSFHHHVSLSLHRNKSTEIQPTEKSQLDFFQTENIARNSNAQYAGLVQKIKINKLSKITLNKCVRFGLKFNKRANNKYY